MDTEINPELLGVVPENQAIKTEPYWYEGILIWAVTIAFIVYLTCHSDFKLPSSPALPTPPTSVPFTVMGLLRKAFSSDDY
jgi:hypothetical protein